MNPSIMPKPEDREATLFALALEKPIAEREAFLEAVCGKDSALRQRLEALLAAHEEDDFMATKTLPEGLGEARGTIALEMVGVPDEAVGQTLGRFKLLEKVGEGGCGVVYVAEQTEPVRRRVALKVIKLGMDTKAVVARFEAERQALAMMDHPNIAKVLDAGTTESGRPYFVMELVRGIRITEYCDQNNLSTKERLDLFIKVCHAIQHAHQKGIIHRDIKPSNILVTLHDGVPVPKVIDFGIAKATEGRLTDATVYTQLHQFIGTPAYMSPEQAEMSGLDIDTRSDIYSLGVLLYELLAGSTPFDAKELMASGIDQMRKMIREKEPARPSTKVATLQGEELTTTAKRRSVEGSRLVHQLRGDIDWIVMKCLEKDRTRRYETANGVAVDLKRHLNNEPVMARPPSAAYRFQKAVRRNKLAFVAGAGVLVALTIVSLLLVRERASFRKLMLSEQKAAVDRVNHAILIGDDKRTQEALREAAGKGVHEAKLRYLRGLYFVTSAQAVLAYPELAEAHRLAPDDASTLGLLAMATISAKGWPKYQLLIPKLLKAKPVTAEDYLFLGWARNVADYKDGIAMMEQSVREKDSPMARLILAEAKTGSADEQRDLAMINSALEDLAAAKAWGYHSLPVLLASCRAHFVASKLYQKAGDSARAKEEKIAADRASERLEAFSPNPQALRMRLQHLLTNGEADKALERLGQWAKEIPSFPRQLFEVWAYMIKGDFKKCYEISSPLNSPPIMPLVSFLSALELPGFEKERERIVQKVITGTSNSDMAGLFTRVAILELSGKTEMVKQLTGDWRRGKDGETEINEAQSALGKYFSGELSATELLKVVHGATWEGTAHNFVALRYLGQGDRVMARRHLEMSIERGNEGETSHVLSQYFLGRLQENPNWPPTIPERTN